MWGIWRAGGEPERSDLGRQERPEAEPWPGLPVLEMIEQVRAGDLTAAGRTFNRLNLDDLPRTYDLELLCFIVDIAAAAGIDDQRRGAYELLAPYAGTHIVVGGCAAYYGAADHRLGILADSLGRTDDAQRHFTAAAEMYDRLGADSWA